MFSRRSCLALLAGAVSACAPSSRDDEVIAVLTRSDEALLLERPSLVAGKYALMATDAHSFYRGTLAVFRHDWHRRRVASSGRGNASGGGSFAGGGAETGGGSATTAAA